MNVKLDHDRLDGVLPLQSTPTSGGHRASPSYGPEGGDSASISDLSSKVAHEIWSEQERVAKRVSELAALYATGNYEPDASPLAMVMVSRALSLDGVES
jgi:hypothetical protein